MRVRCYLRDIRGRRAIRDLSELAGINRGILSTIETGRRLPKDDEIEKLERAYGEPVERWYHPLVIRVLEPDEEGTP